MVTYKTIRIKKKGGGTRAQRVQVLASGKYKFVKNPGTKTKRSKRTVAKKARSYASRAKGIIGKYGVSGLAEDAAVGYIGSQVLMGLGYDLATALPMTRVLQGVAGKVMKRRGGARLEHGIIDLIDVYLIKNGIAVPLSLEAWR